MIFNSNEQLVTELKKAMLDKKITQREISERLGMSPQTFVTLLNKKNFSFSDANKILAAMDYCLHYDFQPK